MSWAVLHPLLPIYASTHRFGGGRPRVPDRSSADTIFMCCEPVANGELWIRPSCVRTRPEWGLGWSRSWRARTRCRGV